MSYGLRDKGHQRIKLTYWYDKLKKNWDFGDHHMKCLITSITGIGEVNNLLTT